MDSGKVLKWLILPKYMNKNIKFELNPKVRPMSKLLLDQAQVSTTSEPIRCN